MHWLRWIVIVLVLLLVWLCLTRVGVYGKAMNGVFKLDVQFGWFHFQILPGKKRAGQESDPKQEKRPSEKKTFPKPTLEDIKSAVNTILPPLKRALNRTRRGIRIHPLRISVTLGGREDPASTAELYGYLHTGMWSVMPWLEQVLDIPDPRVHIGMDFDADQTVFDGEVGLTIRIAMLFAIAVTVGIPALRWFLGYRKKHKVTTPPASGTAIVSERTE